MPDEKPLSEQKLDMAPTPSPTSAANREDPLAEHPVLLVLVGILTNRVVHYCLLPLLLWLGWAVMDPWNSVLHPEGRWFEWTVFYIFFWLPAGSFIPVSGMAMGHEDLAKSGSWSGVLTGIACADLAVILLWVISICNGGTLTWPTIFGTFALLPVSGAVLVRFLCQGATVADIQQEQKEAEEAREREEYDRLKNKFEAEI